MSADETYKRAIPGCPHCFKIESLWYSQMSGVCHVDYVHCSNHKTLEQQRKLSPSSDKDYWMAMGQIKEIEESFGGRDSCSSQGQKALEIREKHRIFTNISEL
jgi:hypothetical protein